jgi:anti-sigma regulatory factor (Ser/Thr protein kinase)
MDNCLLHYHFAAEAANLKDMREQVRGILLNNGFDDAEAERVILGLNEACMNIIEHAYGREYHGDIILNITDQGDCLKFDVIDFAPPIDPDQVRPRDLEEIRPGGLGVHFINEIMDEVQFGTPPGNVGNLLQMRKQKP